MSNSRRPVETSQSHTASDSRQPPLGGMHQQRKGPIKAFESFKERKQEKKWKTARALRQYKQVMHQEGYEAGTGASRKRKREDEETKATKKEAVVVKEQPKTKEQQEREKTRKLKQRRRQSRLMSQRTNRGQPVMKNIVQGILRKLERENK